MLAWAFVILGVVVVTAIIFGYNTYIREMEDRGND